MPHHVIVSPVSREKGAGWRWTAIGRDGATEDYSGEFAQEDAALNDAVARFPDVPLEVRVLGEED